MHRAFARISVRASRRRIALLIAAGLLAITGTMVVAPSAFAGEGHNPGNGCGESSLYYDSNSNNYEIFLHSDWGPITQATYAIWTDGILEVGDGGGFELEGTQAMASGHLADPGLVVHNVYVLGEAYTARGLCAILVSAPYTPFAFGQ